MDYCAQTDLADYILAAYLDKVEEISPGSAAKQIANVSAEIEECIAIGGYTVPAATTAMLKRICSVLSAWRCVGEITSLMSTEAASQNDWLPLQRLTTHAEKDLRDIRDGKLDPVPALSSVETGGGDIQISAPARMFTDDMLKGY